MSLSWPGNALQCPGTAGGSGQVEGGLGFLTIDTVPLTRTKISRKISRYDIRLCNHVKSEACWIIHI